jgi:hypothetical protein
MVWLHGLTWVREVVDWWRWDVDVDDATPFRFEVVVGDEG